MDETDEVKMWLPVEGGGLNKSRQDEEETVNVRTWAVGEGKGVIRLVEHQEGDVSSRTEEKEGLDFDTMGHVWVYVCMVKKGQNIKGIYKNETYIEVAWVSAYGNWRHDWVSMVSTKTVKEDMLN